MVSDLDASQQVVAEKEAARARLLKKLINAQEDERKRIARELHDGVGQDQIGVLLFLIADDHAVLQAGLESMLNAQTIHSICARS